MTDQLKSIQVQRYDSAYEQNVPFTLEEGTDRHFFSTKSSTDEGYDVTHETWSYDGEWITLEITRDARDVDGSLHDETNLYWDGKEKTEQGHPNWISESEYRDIENEC